MDQETEAIGNGETIRNCSSFCIRKAAEMERRTGLRMKMGFEGGQLRRLVNRDLLGEQIADE
jgi:hypothetical protein